VVLLFLQINPLLSKSRPAFRQRPNLEVLSLLAWDLSRYPPPPLVPEESIGLNPGAAEL
jgi:hypothetical protein